MSQSDLRLHFGLGQARQIDLIEVKWPTTQTVEKIHQHRSQPVPDHQRRLRNHQEKTVTDTNPTKLRNARVLNR